MSNFASKDVERIVLNNGEWIELPVEFSFEQMEKVKNADSESERLFVLVKNWGFKDDDGNLVELSLGNFKQLKLEVIEEIAQHILPKLPSENKKKQEIE